MKQKELSVCLRCVEVLVALTVAFLAFLFVPELGREMALQNPNYDFMFWPCLLYIWATVVPVAVALVIAWRIFQEIGRDNSFCAGNARRLKIICYLAILDTGLYVLALVLLAAMNLLHPAVMVAIICVVFFGLTIAAVAAALSHLTQKAADVQSENDLTI